MRIAISSKRIFKAVIVADIIMLMMKSLGTTLMQSFLSYILWGLMMLMYFITFVGSKEKKRVDFAFIGIIIAIAVSAIYSFESINSYSIVGILQFLVTLYVYRWAQSYKPDSDTIMFIKDVAVFKALFFIAVSFTHVGHAAYFSGKIAINDGSLTLGYSNPNLTAIYLINNLCMLLFALRFERFKKKRYNKLLLSIIVFIECLIFDTGSRIVIACSCILILITIFDSIKFVKAILTNKLVILLAIVLPIAFIYIYYYLYENAPNLQFMRFDIYSRISIYNRVINDITDRVLIGNVMKWHFGNQHNGMITIVGSIGVSGALLYTVFMYRVLGRYATFARMNQKANLIGYFTLLIYCLQECVEAAMTGGSIIIATELAMICVLCEMNKKTFNANNSMGGNITDEKSIREN